MFQPKATHPHRNQPRRHQIATSRTQFDQVHQGQIAAEFIVTADSFVVGEKIAAAIENEAILEYLDRLHVMGGVAMHDGDAFINQAMGKRALLRGNVIAPVAAPVDRCDEDIARLLMLSHLTCDSRSGRFREIVEEIDSRGNTRGAPLMWNAAGCRSKCEEKHSSVLC